MSQSLSAQSLFQLPWWQEKGRLQVISAKQPITADPATLLVVVDISPDLADDLKEKLLRVYPPQHWVYVLNPRGQLSEDSAMALADLEPGSQVPGAVVIPPLAEPSAGAHLSNLLGLMAFLRSADGCPWDREQTHASLRPNLLEEAQEAAEAIDSGSTEQLVDELGDVLLQVVFHAQIAQERGCFEFNDIVLNLTEKLIRRHPHIFGQENAQTPGDVEKLWRNVKKSEK